MREIPATIKNWVITTKACPLVRKRKRCGSGMSSDCKHFTGWVGGDDGPIEVECSAPVKTTKGPKTK